MFDSVFKDMLASENLWMKMPIFKENAAALQDYVDAHGTEGVNYLTCRTASMGLSVEKQTKLWLFVNGLPDENVHIVETSDMKRQFLLETGIPWSVDDLPSTVEDCITIPGHNARLLDAPYNQHANLPRVHSLAQFLKEVN